MSSMAVAKISLRWSYCTDGSQKGGPKDAVRYIPFAPSLNTVLNPLLWFMDMFVLEGAT